MDPSAYTLPTAQKSYTLPGALAPPTTSLTNTPGHSTVTGRSWAEYRVLVSLPDTSGGVCSQPPGSTGDYDPRTQPKAAAAFKFSMGPPAFTKSPVSSAPTYARPGSSAPNTGFAPRTALAPPSSSPAPPASSVGPSYKRPGFETPINLEASPKRSKEAEYPPKQEPKYEPEARIAGPDEGRPQRSSLLLALTRRQSEMLIRSLGPELEARERGEEEMNETVQKIARDCQEYR